MSLNTDKLNRVPMTPLAQVTGSARQPVYETEHKETAICPECGHKHRDMWEVNFGPGIEGDTEMDCGECGATFSVSRIATIRYTTRKVPNTSSSATHAGTNHTPKEKP